MRLSPEYLERLRDDVDVDDVIRSLAIPVARRGRRVTFRCPNCARFHTVVSAERNRTYCFACSQSYNTIDLVMAERDCSFLEAVEFLDRLLR